MYLNEFLELETYRRERQRFLDDLERRRAIAARPRQRQGPRQVPPGWRARAAAAGRTRILGAWLHRTGKTGPDAAQTT